MSRLCTEISVECPVEATIYGYTPNLAGNTTLLVFFALCCILQVIIGIRTRIRAFTAVVATACLLEAVGYGARLLMYQNPWSDSGFKIQLVFLILAPSFLAAGVYLTLKHLVLYIGQENSRLPPSLYTWIFIGCDALSIVIQAIGGGIAASTTGHLLDTGNSLMIAGIAIQVVTMSFCALLAVDFALSVFRSSTSRGSRKSAGTEKAARRYFHFYLISSAMAFTTILIRCIYRLPEMAGGWGNSMMRNEQEFLILDGSMIAIAIFLMTAAHPGLFFPAISSRHVEMASKGNKESSRHSGEGILMD